ncbi:hypothetical protein GCM10023311_01820 [Flaviramulus aquimarinus]|uniref:Lipid A 3-O-deacylase (PagL) n=1 Tax=Flaviramulus aquimarinus TaxID=1170456 RepID=A0ABP9ER49_9FLAO
MKQYFLFSFFMVSIFILCAFVGNAQIKKEHLKLGFTYGTGSQNRFPFDLKDYTHEITFYKVQINYLLKQKRKWAFEFNLEPSYNVAEHQLLNKWFVKQEDTDNFEVLRDLYTQKRTIKEYVLNLGLIARYTIYKDISMYAIASVGPMIADRPTERLAKGFAFSDVFGLGLSYKINTIQLDFRYTFRHTSNLEFQQPNNGHNTTNTEISVLFDL